MILQVRVLEYIYLNLLLLNVHYQSHKHVHFNFTLNAHPQYHKHVYLSFISQFDQLVT